MMFFKLKDFARWGIYLNGNINQPKTSEPIHKNIIKCLNVSSSLPQNLQVLGISTYLETVELTGYILCNILKWIYLVLLGRKYLWGNSHALLQSILSITAVQWVLPRGKSRSLF